MSGSTTGQVGPKGRRPSKFFDKAAITLDGAILDAG
jgi:hypothetical protein